MLQSRVISEASLTFISIREFMVLWFYVNRVCFSNSRVLFVYISTSFIFQVSYPYLGQFQNLSRCPRNLST